MVYQSLTWKNKFHLKKKRNRAYCSLFSGALNNIKIHAFLQSLSILYEGMDANTTPFGPKILFLRGKRNNDGLDDKITVQLP